MKRFIAIFVAASLFATAPALADTPARLPAQPEAAAPSEPAISAEVAPRVQRIDLFPPIARMDSNGWLTLAEGAGREQRLTLSAKGRALLLTALPVWTRAQARTTAVLGQRGADSIRSLGDTVFSQQSQD